MENKYKNVRAWLLSKERYEDIVKFDKSDQAKEELYCEMAGESCTSPSSDDEVVQFKSTKEIKEEIYRKYNYIIEAANDYPENINKNIMHLIEIIAIKSNTINTQAHHISFMRKYWSPGKG